MQSEYVAGSDGAVLMTGDAMAFDPPQPWRFIEPADYLSEEGRVEVMGNQGKVIWREWI